jgi:hypothetical protein
MHGSGSFTIVALKGLCMNALAGVRRAASTQGPDDPLRMTPPIAGILYVLTFISSIRPSYFWNRVE